MQKLIIVLVLCSSCLQVASGQKQSQVSESILIVYLSRTNNTKAIADIIYKEVGGDLVALDLENPYPEDYDAIVKQVAEENESGFLPPLKTKVDIDKYDTIFLGFPTWGMQLPPPMKSFLNKYDLSNKTVIPFNTNAGYGIGSSFRTIEELCPNSKILKGFSIQGGIERDGVFLTIKGERKKEVVNDLTEWLTRIGVLVGNK